jgi:hypothetical protein
MLIEIGAVLLYADLFLVVLDELGGVLLLQDRIEEGEGKIHHCSSYF